MLRHELGRVTVRGEGIVKTQVEQRYRQGHGLQGFHHG